MDFDGFSLDFGDFHQISTKNKDFLKKSKNIKFLKYFFSIIENIFHPNFFLYDLEFSYAFDLAHFERQRGQRECTKVSETQKHDIVQIPAGFA